MSRNTQRFFEVLSDKDWMARERKEENRLFFAGVVLFAVFLFWFQIFDIGLGNGDRSVAAWLTEMVERGMGRVSSDEAKSQQAVLYQARVLLFVLAEVAIFTAGFGFYGNGIFRLSVETPPSAKRFHLVFFVLPYVFITCFFFRFGAAWSCTYTDCSARANGHLREPVFYLASFMIIACTPFFVSVLFRMTGLDRTMQSE